MHPRPRRSKLVRALLRSVPVIGGLVCLTSCSIMPTPLAQLNDFASVTCDLGSANSDDACFQLANNARCESHEYQNGGCTGTGCALVPVYQAEYTLFTTCNEKSSLDTVKKGNVTKSDRLSAQDLTAASQSSNPEIHEFPISTPSARPGAIIAGPDGNVWFTENNAGNAASITPSGAITEQHVGVDTNVVSGIAVDSKGRICVASILREYQGQAEADDVECFSPTRGSSYELAIVDAKTAGLVNGPDGFLWYTQAGTNGLGRLNVTTFLTEQAQIFPTNAADPNKVDAPAAIITGPGGTIWFSELLGNRIGLVATGSTADLTLFDLPTAGSGPAGLAAGPDGAIWFTEFNGNRIGRIASNGALAEYSIPTASSQPLGIAAGSDGALWFTEFAANHIGRITTQGVLTEYTVPTAGSGPAGIVSGPDGDIWFTELLGNKIGKLTVEKPAGCASPGRGCIGAVPAPTVVPIHPPP